MSFEERRIHPRLQVYVQVRISGPNGVMEGELKDISKGGAGILLKTSVGAVGDLVELFLPFSGDEEIAVQAEILRVQESPEGQTVGLRFNIVEPVMYDKLMALNELLLNAHGGRTRSHPRVAKRIPIQYRGQSELRAILENVSLGGIALTVENALVLDEKVEVEIPLPGSEMKVVLAGKVIYQHPIREGAGSRYRVGFKFLKLTSDQEADVQNLLRRLLASNPTDKK